jgi:hypothetical protein
MEILQKNVNGLELMINSRGDRMPISSDSQIVFEGLMGARVRVLCGPSRMYCELKVPESKGLIEFDISESEQPDNLEAMIARTRVALNGRL